MLGIVHLLFGAALGGVISTPSVAFVAALFSHYLLDLLPHLDPETFVLTYRKYTWIEFIFLLLDITAVIATLIILYVWYGVNNSIVIASIAAQLPDWFMPLEKYNFFSPFHKMHTMFHWEPRRASHWSWYIAGIVLPLTVGAVSLTVLLWQ